MTDCRKVVCIKRRIVRVVNVYRLHMSVCMLYPLITVRLKTLCIMAIHWVMFRHSAVGSDTSSQVMTEVTPWLKCCSVICLLSIWLTAACFSISNHTLDLHWILLIIDLQLLWMVQSQLTRGLASDLDTVGLNLISFCLLFFCPAASVCSSSLLLLLVLLL